MRLCLSTYLTLLNLCRVPGATKFALGRAVLSCLNETGEDCYYSSPTISDLSRGRKNLGEAESQFALGCDRAELSRRLADVVVPLLDENKLSRLVAALQRVVAEDDAILLGTEVDLVGHRSKEEFVAACEHVVPDALAGVLVYCAAKVRNRGTHVFPSEVTPELLDAVDERSCELVLRRRPASGAVEEVIWRRGPNSIMITEGDLFDARGGSGRSIVVIPVDAGFSTRLTRELGGAAVAGVSENTIHGKWLELCGDGGGARRAYPENLWATSPWARRRASGT